MITKELEEYIKLAKSKNISETDIISNLGQQGWNQDEIKAYLENSLIVPKPPIPNSTASMWDTFEHILLFITLYVLAVSIGLIIHFFIDKYTTNALLSNSYFIDSTNYLLRGYLASLIVSFPLFAFFFLRLTKKTRNFPVIRQLKSRKSLIYFTLVMTFLIVLFNIISLVYGFLSGNTTQNFILKFLTTVFISGMIFIYYLGQIKEDRKIYA